MFNNTTMIRLSHWFIIGLTMMGTTTLAQAVKAQSPHPIQVAQDLREPVGRIDPDQPIQITVVSQTDAPFVATVLQPAVGDRPVDPGETVTFGRLHTAYLPVPIDMTAYVEMENIRLYMDVRTSANEIIVEVTTVPQDDDDSNTPGNATQSLNVNAAGSIFVY